MAEMPHMKRRESDEWYCPRCSLRWPHDEEAPNACVENRSKSPAQIARAAQRLAESSHTHAQRRYWNGVRRYHQG